MKKNYLFKVMKLCILIITCGFLQLSAASFSQTITLKGTKIPFTEVMEAIRKQTNHEVAADESVIRSAQPVTVTSQDMKLQEFLSVILRDQPIDFTIENETVFLKRASRKVEESRTVQTRDITGQVLSKSGEPIVGANVTIKGTRNMAVTNVEGKFSIKANPGQVAVIRFIGFQTREVAIGAETNLRIQLEETNESLGEVVVTGIVNQSKSTFTGAAMTFNSEELNQVSNNNVLTALKSLDPSFQIPENINLGSNPNVLPDVVLRGGNTLVDISQGNVANPFNYQQAPNAPLFILDGFETTLQRINDLDMNRVERVTILKDAGATAIYGSRGANGVIVIEQKRPEAGKLLFTYNGNMTVEVPDLAGYNLLNAREKFELEDRSDIYKYSWNSVQNHLDLVRSARMKAVERGINTDWISKPLRNGIGQKHNVYIEGGADAVTYGLGITHDQTLGVMKGSDRRTTTANSSLSYRLDKFQFRNELHLHFNTANNSPYGSFKQYTQLNPYWSPYDEQGNLKMYLEEVIDPQTGARITQFDSYNNLNGYTGRPVNPLYNASLNITDQTAYKGITNNFEVRWQTNSWLRLTGRFSYSQQNDESDIFLPAQHSSFSNIATFNKGSYTKGYGYTQNMEGFLTGEVNKNFGLHFISGSATVNIKENAYNTTSFRVQGFPNSNLDELVLGNQFPDGSKPTGMESIVRSIGSLVRGSYSYDNTYLFDATYRLDGSSLFGASRRFAPFWSIGAGWNLHQEEFLQDQDVIDQLRLRYTLGTTGSESFESYKGITTSQYYTDREYRGVISSYLLGFGNEALAWQKTRKNNLGFEMTLFNRLSVNANYFHERTVGSIAMISTAPSSGFNTYYDNMGDVVNKGFEIYSRFNLIASPVNRNNWSVFFNGMHVSNKIEKISKTIEALNRRANNTTSTTPLPRYQEGQSRNVIWAVQSLGIDPASGTELFLTRDGEITSVYNPAQQVIVGDATSTLSGTFGTNMELNGIGFNVYLRFDFGGDAYNQTLIDRVENVNVAMYNVDSRVAEQRWEKPGDIAFFKGILDFSGSTNTARTMASSRFVQKNNFLTGESISMYYRLPETFNQRFGVRNTRITLQGSEFFRISTIKRERGLDYPFGRTFSLQLQTSF